MDTRRAERVAKNREQDASHWRGQQVTAVPGSDQVFHLIVDVSGKKKWRKRRKNEQKKPKNRDPKC